MIDLKHPSVLAAMAGRNTGEFCRKIGELGVGMVTVGGISVDEKSMEASRKMAERGRDEFLFDNLYDFLEEHIPRAQESNAAVCVNIRSSTDEGYIQACEMITEHKALVELNAHCRQKEMVDAGAGQALLKDLQKLRSIGDTLKEIGINPIIKFRGNVISERKILETVQPDAVHIDAYKEGEKGFDFTVFEKIKDFDCFKIGNNSVNTPEIALEVLELCDAFSFAQIAWNENVVKDLVTLNHSAGSRLSSLSVF
jgi:TIM-barrel protein